MRTLASRVLLPAFLLLVFASLARADTGPPAAADAGWLLAVFALEDLAPSEDTKGLGEEIAATLTGGFARSGKVRIVERKRLRQILEELQLGNPGLVDERTAARAGRLLGANALVLGSFLKFRDSVRIHVRVVKTETGEILSTGRVSGKFSRLPDLEEEIATGILHGIQPQHP
jgi:TolB-like protein